MKNKKRTGSYYTPKPLADFMIDYLNKKLGTRFSLRVLEPSAGDGSFVNASFNHSEFAKKINSFIAVERNGKELNKIRIQSENFIGVRADFLEYQKYSSLQFDLVIGNPPYIKKNLLSQRQISICKDIHSRAKLSNRQPNNIWTAFLVRCIEFTSNDGILGFILPAELLQVKFSSELRSLLISEFERIEIFTFNELLFSESKGQDTLILICERKSCQKGVFYCNIDKIADLNQGRFNLVQNINIKNSKWMHHHLSSDEINLLERLKENINTIDNYCNSKAGIVTAANNFFIVNEATVEKYQLHNFVMQIIQKGVFVNGSIELNTDDFQHIIDSSKPAYLISFNHSSNIKDNKKIDEYLKIGKANNLHLRYKMSIREKWYEVPNIGNPPDAFFFKRCNKYPKLIKNNAKVLSTDSAYNITMKDNFYVNDLIFSFYNSLTLSFSELNGRYYGGGVLELTPNEFKKLPIPFVNIIESKFSEFVKSFKNKNSITDIFDKNDLLILKTVDKRIDSDVLINLKNIREKLFHRRIKTG